MDDSRTQQAGLDPVGQSQHCLPQAVPFGPGPGCTSYTDHVGVTITPKRRMVLMRSLAPKKTEGGIIVPDTATKGSDVGPHELEVLAHGPGSWKDGIWWPIEVRVGERVLVHGERRTFGGEALMLTNAEGTREKYYLLDEEFLCAGIARTVEPERKIITPSKAPIVVPKLQMRRGGKK
jgi:co-chaperonin GroES (HSP10)